MSIEDLIDAMADDTRTEAGGFAAAIRALIGSALLAENDANSVDPSVVRGLMIAYVAQREVDADERGLTLSASALTSGDEAFYAMFDAYVKEYQRIDPKADRDLLREDFDWPRCLDQDWLMPTSFLRAEGARRARADIRRARAWRELASKGATT